MNDKASRNQREGKYYGKYRRRHRRIGISADGYGVPIEAKECDWKITRFERRRWSIARKHYDYHDGEPV